LETIVKKLYEAMFLVDSSQAGADWDGLIATIKGILGRAEAEIVSLRKWGDRRLAYEIDHKTKGTYILCYFRADGDRIRDIEKSIQLSERVMRVLILSAEKRTAEDIEKDAAEVVAEKPKAETGHNAQAEEQSAEQEGEEDATPEQ